VTLNQGCVIENTPYIIYVNDGDAGELIDIVSRDNCRIGSYCDGTKLTCMPNKNITDSCAADKECDSYNCLGSGVCGDPADTPKTFPAWVYFLVVLGIISGLFGTIWVLYVVHSKQRDKERERRIQYWREQNAFRQNILQMRDTAFHIIGQSNAAASSRNSIYSRDDSHSVAHYTTQKQVNEYDYVGMMMAEPEPMPIERRPDGRF